MKWVRKVRAYFTREARALRAANRPTRYFSFRRTPRARGGMLPSPQVALAIYQAAMRKIGRSEG